MKLKKDCLKERRGSLWYRKSGLKFEKYSGCLETNAWNFEIFSEI